MISNRLLISRLPRVLLDLRTSAHWEPKSMAFVVSLYLLNFESKL